MRHQVHDRFTRAEVLRPSLHKSVNTSWIFVRSCVAQLISHCCVDRQTSAFFVAASQTALRFRLGFSSGWLVFLDLIHLKNNFPLPNQERVRAIGVLDLDLLRWYEEHFGAFCFSKNRMPGVEFGVVLHLLKNGQGGSNESFANSTALTPFFEGETVELAFDLAAETFRCLEW